MRQRRRWVLLLGGTLAAVGMLGRIGRVAAPRGGPQAGSYDALVMSSLQKVLPGTGQLPGAHPNPAVIQLARRESEAVQVVIRSPSALHQVRLETHDLRHEDNDAVLPAGAITWSPVGFVNTRRPDYPVSHVGLWPDPLPGPGPFEVRAKFPQPVWITVTTPASAKPGRYRGMITVRPANAPPRDVQMDVTVWDFELPATPSLKSAFDVYPGRIRNAYEQFFPEWAAAWAARPGGWQALEQQLYDDLTRHRLAPILNIAATPDAVARVQALQRAGLSAFAVGQYGGSFDNNWPKDPAALAALVPIYRAYAETLRSHGLLDRQYVYTYDEPRPGLPEVADVARMIHDADPTLKNLVTLGEPFDLDAHAAWFKDLDIICVRNVAFDSMGSRQLQQMGKEVWLYVSGPQPPYPTLVIDYPAIAYRILPWMCWKYGVTGLLYWSVNYWTTNPYVEPMNTRWKQNGNGSLYYPGPDGPVPSLRLEVLRDGIEDYEYLALLRQAIVRLEALEPPRRSANQALIERATSLTTVDDTLVASMKEYTDDPEQLAARRAAIASVLEECRRVERTGEQQKKLEVGSWKLENAKRN